MYQGQILHKIIINKKENKAKNNIPKDNAGILIYMPTGQIKIVTYYFKMNIIKKFIENTKHCVNQNKKNLRNEATDSIKNKNQREEIIL